MKHYQAIASSSEVRKGFLTDTLKMSTIISARSLSKKYSHGYALKDLTFEIGREKIAVLGFNGAGKSTLAKLIAGITKPTSGEIFVFNSQPHQDPEVRRRIGVVTHNPMLYSDLTVRENLKFYAKIFGVNYRRIDEILENLDLKDRADVRVSQLSRGFLQRVSVGRALLPDPEVLVMDEPTTGLDFKSRDWLLGFLREKDCCIVFTTHSFQEAEFCDRYLVLLEGQIKYFGTDLRAARGVFNVSRSNKEGSPV